MIPLVHDFTTINLFKVPEAMCSARFDKLGQAFSQGQRGGPDAPLGCFETCTSTIHWKLVGCEPLLGPIYGNGALSNPLIAAAIYSL